MSYLSQFSKVKPALTPVAAGDLDRVMVRGGRIYATDELMTISTPFRSDLEFFVNGMNFGAAIKPKDVVLSMDGNHLVVTHGAATTILESAALKDFPRPTGKWKPLPEYMMPAFRALAPFQANDRTHLWACGITIREGKCYATDNKVVGVWDGRDDGIDVTFPRWLVDYLLRFKEEPVGYIIKKTWIGFRFEDDTEVHSGRIARELSNESVDRCAAIPRRGLPIPPGWFEAIEYVSKLPGAETVTVAPDFIWSETRSGIHRREIKSPCTKETAWDPKLLKRIAHVATHIDLDAWPKPASWYGKNVRGSIAGTKYGNDAARPPSAAISGPAGMSMGTSGNPRL